MQAVQCNTEAQVVVVRAEVDDADAGDVVDAEDVLDEVGTRGTFACAEVLAAE